MKTWSDLQVGTPLEAPARVEQRDAPSISDAFQVCPSDGPRPVTSHNVHWNCEEGRQRYKERHEATSSVPSN